MPIAAAPRITSLADVADAWPTIAEVFDVLLLRAGYNTNLVILGTTLLGLAAGIVGVFALLRKRALMADAVSHATLPGIGAAFLFATAAGIDGRSLPVLLFGAAISAAIGVAAVQLILRTTRLREDAAIGAVLSVFFGAGVVILSYIQKNAAGSAAGLNKFIYGQTAAMSAADAALMAAIAIAATLSAALLLKEFALVCFNDSFARVDGWSVTLIDALMMTLVVLVTIAGLQAVGLILVVAMLIIPPVSARLWTERLWVLVILAGLIGAASGYLGASVSALLPRKPAGAVIVLTAGLGFTISLLAAPARGVLATLARRYKLNLRMAADHLLEEAYENNNTLTPAARKQLARQRGWSTLFETITLASLRRRKLISRTAGTIHLTPAGTQSGARISRNHQLWEQYLVTYADIAPSHVDWSVDQVEHILSDTLIEELEAALAKRGAAT